MARPKKVQKVKEPVRIRKRKLANGNMSLYLDVYVKGVRKVESLGLYLVPEQTPIDKQQNAHAMQVAGKIKAERILALQNHGVRQWNKVKRSCITLIDFLKEYEQEKFGFSASTLKGRRDLRLKVETYLNETSPILYWPMWMRTFAVASSLFCVMRKTACARTAAPSATGRHTTIRPC